MSTSTGNKCRCSHAGWRVMASGSTGRPRPKTNFWYRKIAVLYTCIQEILHLKLIITLYKYIVYNKQNKIISIIILYKYIVYNEQNK